MRFQFRVAAAQTRSEANAILAPTVQEKWRSQPRPRKLADGYTFHAHSLRVAATALISTKRVGLANAATPRMVHAGAFALM